MRGRGQFPAEPAIPPSQPGDVQVGSPLRRKRAADTRQTRGSKQPPPVLSTGKYKHLPKGASAFSSGPVQPYQGLLLSGQNSPIKLCPYKLQFQLINIPFLFLFFLLDQ